MKIAIAAAFLVLCCCIGTAFYVFRPIPGGTVFDPPESNLRTIEHDGHRWVMPVSTRSVPPVHHPDCPCHSKP